ncbi:MAG: hypothetical protein JKP98_02155 [Rhodobacteraceae bacterium]|nr:hypothetical protein [Paracoccaceae bacterium]
MAAFYGGATYKSYSRAHGTQIEYLASNGRAYLWYPGNTRVVPGAGRPTRTRQATC